MKYEKIKVIKPEDFRRLTGVKVKTYEKMVEIVGNAQKAKKAQGGRKNKLSVEDMVLMALEYLREYGMILEFLRSLKFVSTKTYLCKPTQAIKVSKKFTKTQFYPKRKLKSILRKTRFLIIQLQVQELQTNT